MERLRNNNKTCAIYLHAVACGFARRSHSLKHRPIAIGDSTKTWCAGMGIEGFDNNIHCQCRYQDQPAAVKRRALLFFVQS